MFVPAYPQKPERTKSPFVLVAACLQRSERKISNACPCMFAEVKKKKVSTYCPYLPVFRGKKEQPVSSVWPCMLVEVDRYSQ